MAKILSLRRWERFEFEAAGVALACEVKRLNSLEAGPIRAALAKAQGQLADSLSRIQRLREEIPDEPPEPEGKPADLAPDATEEERKAHDAVVEAWLRQHPEYLETLRERTRLAAKALSLGNEVRAEWASAIPAELLREVFGKYVRNVEGLELDGAAATSGLDLLEVADDEVVAAVVGRLRALSELSAREGKASASPSTSSPGGVTGAGDSGAPSTDAGAGPAS